MFSSIDSTMRLYFTFGDTTTINSYTPSSSYNIKRGENTLCIPVSELNGWSEGKLKYFRIDPLSADGEFEIDYVALVK